MKNRSIAAALLLTFTPASLTAVTFSAPAHAQDDATTKAARARFQEGVEFFDKGQFENARAAFLQAYALRKHPSVLLNLAQSSLRSGHHLEAARYFQQYLRESTNITAQQRSDAERGLTEARMKLGRIVIDAPPSHEILVDDERIGTTPLPPVDVEPGTHTVKSRAQKDETVQITVSAGQQVTAKFGASAPPPAAVPVPVPTPAPTPAPAPAPTPTPKEEPPAAPAEPASEPPSSATTELSTGKKNLTPAYISGGIAIAAFGTAIAMAIAKSSAQSSADDVANQIRSRREKDIAANPDLGLSLKGVCSSTDPTDVKNYAKACATLKDNNDKVDTDAKVANIALGVGIAAAVFTVGWILLAPRSEPEPNTAATLHFAPIVGPGIGGLSVGGAF